MQLTINMKECIEHEDIENTFDIMKQLDVLPCNTVDEYVELMNSSIKTGYKVFSVTYESDSAIIAAVGIRMYFDPFFKKRLFVHDLIVSNDSRFQGVGKQIMQWLEAYAEQEGCTAVTLTASNSRPEVDADKFYERIGYVKAGTYYSK
jgi:GNAT superfamily N-acetyltransferase